MGRVAQLSILCAFVMVFELGYFPAAHAEGTAFSTYDSSACGLEATGVARGFRVSGRLTHKIMGGRDAKAGELPWAVAVFEEATDFYLCAGTLVSTRHVVTAAHCFFKVGKQRTRFCEPSARMSEEEAIALISIRYGNHILKDGKNMKIKRAQFSKFFESRCLKLDYALIELTEDIDPTIASYACLPHRSSIEQATKLTDARTFGWGTNPAVQDPFKEMQVLQVLSFSKLISRITCLKFWPSVGEDSICSPEVNKQNTCTGDSGGGLIARSASNQWVLLGVTSYGSDCESMLKGVPGTAQVYTDMTLHSATVDIFTETRFPWIGI